MRLILYCVLASQCASKTPIQRGFGSSNIQKRADSHTDHVQCDHGKPESFRGQESRFEPSRQYLPQPAQESRTEPSRQYLPQPGPVPPSSPPNDIEAPAASFDQPNFLSVENTFVSPSIQNNYKSLFGQDNKKDLIIPAAAQNPPSNSVPPPAPRITSDKKHSHDDEDNLERLCNDAFHSFLCKPIKGPRKTPTGRLRPNAVIPPDVLSGFASFQDVTRVKPDPPKPITPTPKPFSQFPTTRYTLPISTTKRYEPLIPEIPSPSNNNLQIIKPQPSNVAPLKAAAQTMGYFYEKPAIPFPSQVGFPSNQNQLFVSQQPTYQTPRPTTSRPVPTKGYSYDKPNIPFPSNTIQKYAQPPKHDCDKGKSSSPFLIPNPSNENPAFIKPYTPPTPKPVTNTFYTRPVITSPSSYTPFRTATQTTKTPTTHDCQKHSFYFTPTEKPKLPLPSNNIAQIIAPSTPKPAVRNYYQKPIFPSPSNEFIRTSPPPYIPAHDCKKHSPFISSTTEKPRLPSASNNIAQIIAQPQQINTVTISPQKPSGYFYEKPAVPFSPPPRPTTQRPTPPPFTYQTTKRPQGYNYEQPRVPFPSNNIAQIISARPSTTTTPKAPCEHEKHTSPVVSNPTNQNQISLKPAAASEAYVYDKPNRPFNGYSYEKPANPFLLPSPANNSPQVIASPANNGYTYEKPNRPFPPQTNIPSNNNQVTVNPPKSPPTSKPSGYSYEAPKIPFPTNINSKIVAPDKPNYVAKPQTQVEVAVRPGYSYDRPSNPFTGEQGYTYPEPAAPFR